ncbi:hypothetical protein J3E68DRAFT_394145 [Trichoderma sp. SZMC 28012]|uniref:Uncharacterized protein n=1 Tax=Trichoderma harzianum CBS 226.95 TaxID=983964 RepID=A0A2T4AJB6_TRIHA|nr:hypothetical protein M431DRAFT_506759 [Trichoderma harzianum CBS 226.95]PTB57018.1 hypothetical protein M431DRAFT_506759 [Trichoderma harzianum CBS 226.95]
MQVLLVVLPGMLPAKAAIGKSSKSLALCMTSGTTHHSGCFATDPNLCLLPRPVPQVANTRANNYQILAPEAID